MKHILLTALFQARVLMSINHQHVMNIIKEWHLAHYTSNRGKAVKRAQIKSHRQTQPLIRSSTFHVISIHLAMSIN